MNDGDKNADDALALIREWQWNYCDPDGQIWPQYKDLRSTLATLAMDGLSKPHISVLALLCKGDLIARGWRKWRKYEAGEFYQNDEELAVIKPKQWQTLASLIAEQERQWAEKSTFPDIIVDLERLGFPKCSIYEWEHGQGRFSTAVIPAGIDINNQGYFEELYSFWDIEVYPRFLDEIDQNSEPTPIADQTNKGGRPPAADWEAVVLEMAGLYYIGDLKPKTVADVARAMATWLGKQDIHLSDSVLREHAKPVFEAFQAWNAE